MEKSVLEKIDTYFFINEKTNLKLYNIVDSIPKPAKSQKTKICFFLILARIDCYT